MLFIIITLIQFSPLAASALFIKQMDKSLTAMPNGKLIARMLKHVFFVNIYSKVSSTASPGQSTAETRMPQKIMETSLRRNIRSMRRSKPAFAGEKSLLPIIEVIFISLNITGTLKY